jgi:hypothetical protein
MTERGKVVGATGPHTQVPGAPQVVIELTFVPYELCDIKQRLAWDRLWTWLLANNYVAQGSFESCRPRPQRTRGGRVSKRRSSGVLTKEECHNDTTNYLG